MNGLTFEWLPIYSFLNNVTKVERKVVRKPDQL